MSLSSQTRTQTQTSTATASSTASSTRTSRSDGTATEHTATASSSSPSSSTSAATTVSMRDRDMRLHLGDIVQLQRRGEPSTADPLASPQYIVDDLSPTHILLVEVAPQPGAMLELIMDRTGQLTYPDDIAHILLLNSSHELGYARQHGLLPGARIAIFFQPPAPPMPAESSSRAPPPSTVVRMEGRVTNLENDTIEIALDDDEPDAAPLYIDFRYQGIPRHMHIDHIEILPDTAPLPAAQAAAEAARPRRTRFADIEPQIDRARDEYVQYRRDYLAARAHDPEQRRAVEDMTADEMFGDMFVRASRSQRIERSADEHVAMLRDGLLMPLSPAQRTPTVMDRLARDLTAFRVLRDQGSVLNDQNYIERARTHPANIRAQAEDLAAMRANPLWQAVVTSVQYLGAPDDRSTKAEDAPNIMTALRKVLPHSPKESDTATETRLRHMGIVGNNLTGQHVYETVQKHVRRQVAQYDAPIVEPDALLAQPVAVAVDAYHGLWEQTPATAEMSPRADDLPPRGQFAPFVASLSPTLPPLARRVHAGQYSGIDATSGISARTPYLTADTVMPSSLMVLPASAAMYMRIYDVRHTLIGAQSDLARWSFRREPFLKNRHVSGRTARTVVSVDAETLWQMAQMEESRRPHNDWAFPTVMPVSIPKELEEARKTRDAALAAVQRDDDTGLSEGEQALRRAASERFLRETVRFQVAWPRNHAPWTDAQRRDIFRMLCRVSTPPIGALISGLPALPVSHTIYSLTDFLRALAPFGIQENMLRYTMKRSILNVVQGRVHQLMSIQKLMRALVYREIYRTHGPRADKGVIKSELLTHPMLSLMRIQLTHMGTRGRHGLDDDDEGPDSRGSRSSASTPTVAWLSSMYGFARDRENWMQAIEPPRRETDPTVRPIPPRRWSAAEVVAAAQARDGMELLTLLITWANQDILVSEQVSHAIETQLERQRATLKEKRMQDTCAMRIVAKQYFRQDELEADSRGPDHAVYFDTDRDHTDYSVMSVVGKPDGKPLGFAVELLAMSTEALTDHIFKMLKRFWPRPADGSMTTDAELQTLAETLAEGRKRVQDGHFATLTKNDGTVAVFYVRDHGRWILADPELTRDLDIDAGASAAQCITAQPGCIAVTPPEIRAPPAGGMEGTRDSLAQCISNEVALADLGQQRLQGMVDAFDQTLQKNQIEVRKKLLKQVRRLMSRESRHRGPTRPMSLHAAWNVNAAQFQAGAKWRALHPAAAGNLESAASPFAKYLDLILSLSSTRDQHFWMAWFGRKFTRAYNETLDGPARTAEGEWTSAPFWAYCTNSDLPLVPTFRLRLAQAFLESPQAYRTELAAVQAEQAAASAPGEGGGGQVFDKYTGWIICDAPLESLVEFDENDRVITATLAVANTVDTVQGPGHITGLRSGEPEPEPSVDLTPEQREQRAEAMRSVALYTSRSDISRDVQIVLSALRGPLQLNLGIEAAWITSVVQLSLGAFIRSNGLGDVLRNNQYAALRAEAHTPSELSRLESRHREAVLRANRQKMALILGAILVIMQCTHPSLSFAATAHAMPDCTPSLSGLPLMLGGADGSEASVGGITFLSCVALRVASDAAPWSAWYDRSTGPGAAEAAMRRWSTGRLTESVKDAITAFLLPMPEVQRRMSMKRRRVAEAAVHAEARGDQAYRDAIHDSWRGMFPVLWPLQLMHASPAAAEDETTDSDAVSTRRRDAHRRPATMLAHPMDAIPSSMRRALAVWMHEPADMDHGAAGADRGMAPSQTELAFRARRRLDGRIMRASLAMQEVVHDVVRGKTPLIRSANQTVLTNNACCSTRVTDGPATVFAYFVQESDDRVLEVLNQQVHTWSTWNTHIRWCQRSVMITPPHVIRVPRPVDTAIRPEVARAAVKFWIRQPWFRDRMESQLGTLLSHRGGAGAEEHKEPAEAVARDLRDVEADDWIRLAAAIERLPLQVLLSAIHAPSVRRLELSLAAHTLQDDARHVVRQVGAAGTAAAASTAPAAANDPYSVNAKMDQLLRTGMDAVRVFLLAHADAASPASREGAPLPRARWTPEQVRQLRHVLNDTNSRMARQWGIYFPRPASSRAVRHVNIIERLCSDLPPANGQEDLRHWKVDVRTHATAMLAFARECVVRLLFTCPEWLIHYDRPSGSPSIQRLLHNGWLAGDTRVPRNAALRKRLRELAHKDWGVLMYDAKKHTAVMPVVDALCDRVRRQMASMPSMADETTVLEEMDEGHENDNDADVRQHLRRQGRAAAARDMFSPQAAARHGLVRLLDDAREMVSLLPPDLSTEELEIVPELIMLFMHAAMAEWAHAARDCEATEAQRHAVGTALTAILNRCMESKTFLDVSRVTLQKHMLVLRMKGELKGITDRFERMSQDSRRMYQMQKRLGFIPRFDARKFSGENYANEANLRNADMELERGLHGWLGEQETGAENDAADDMDVVDANGESVNTDESEGEDDEGESVNSAGSDDEDEDAMSVAGYRERDTRGRDRRLGAADMDEWRLYDRGEEEDENANNMDD